MNVKIINVIGNLALAGLLFYGGYYYRDHRTPVYPYVGWTVERDVVKDTFIIRFDHPITWTELDHKTAANLAKQLTAQ